MRTDCLPVLHYNFFFSPVLGGLALGRSAREVRCDIENCLPFFQASVVSYDGGLLFY